jgi:2,3-dihydroxybenzoate-AMP ligase/mycobactin salicyl-AMP ligase
MLEGFTPYRQEDAESYNRLRWWLGMTWGDVFDKATDLYPNKIGLVDDLGRWTYRELRHKVDRLASGLIKLGLEKGDCVLVQTPNWHEYIFSFFALQKIGTIVVMLVPRHNQIEINHFASLTKAKAWILPTRYGKIDYEPIVDGVLRQNPQLKHLITARGEWAGKSENFEKLMNEADLNGESLQTIRDRRPDPGEVAQVMPTGGTTGMPKAAPRTHNDYLNNVEYHSRAWEITSNDTLLVITPVAHGMGMHWGIGGAFFNFARLVLLDSTEPETICETIQREKVTALPSVPAIVTRIVNLDNLGQYDLGSLKKISVGGAPSTPDLVKAVWTKIGCKYHNGLGSVEGTCAATRTEDDIETICYSVGKQICPYDTLKIVDSEGNELPQGREGELVSKGPGIFTGYFKSPEDNKKVFTEDGFFRTGDLARKDERGYIYITGRIKDIINRGGEKVSAVEIENLISEHGAVESVAVIGMPDMVLGERICAYVKPAAGKSVTVEEIIGFLKDKGASVLQLPERIEFVESLPLTNVGKHDKKALREDIRKRMGWKE